MHQYEVKVSWSSAPPASTAHLTKALSLASTPSTRRYPLYLRAYFNLRDNISNKMPSTHKCCTCKSREMSQWINTFTYRSDSRGEDGPSTRRSRRHVYNCLTFTALVLGSTTSLRILTALGCFLRGALNTNWFITWIYTWIDRFVIVYAKFMNL